MAISLSTLQGNLAQGPGGAIHNFGILSVVEDTLANNSTQGSNLGGGLADEGTFANVDKSTFNGNNALGGGGMLLSGTQVYVANTTLSGNFAFGGGGVLVETGTAIVDNATIYQNLGVGGAAIERTGGAVYVENSILAGNPGNNCFGVVTSQGHNIEDGSDCLFTKTGDMQNTIPMLGPLADNGGPTQTFALLPGSPAIKHGYRPDCQGWDQRFYLRVGGCDIGAFQIVFRVLEPVVRR